MKLRLALGTMFAALLALDTGLLLGQDRPPTIFFDDFDSEPAAEYMAGLGEDSFQIINGDLILSSPATSPFNDVGPRSLVLNAGTQSIVTQARYDGPAEGGVGAFLRGGGFGSIGGAIIGGNLAIFRDERGDTPFEFLVTAPTSLDIAQETMLRVDVTEISIGDTEGNRIELWAWSAGESMPQDPQLAFDDPGRLSPPEGWPGLVVAGFGQQASATFASFDVAAIPEPTSLALTLVLTLISVVLLRRRLLVCRMRQATSPIM